MAAKYQQLGRRNKTIDSGSGACQRPVGVGNPKFRNARFGRLACMWQGFYPESRVTKCVVAARRLAEQDTYAKSEALSKNRASLIRGG